MAKSKAAAAFKMPKRVRVTDRSSSINNSFANGIVPVIKPLDDEIEEALAVLGMTPDTVRCAYCGDPCTQWDHLNPLVVDTMPTGYITEIHNLVPCCGTCNQSKGNQPWRSWMTGGASQSPASRGVADLDDRISRLEEYERAFVPVRLDFEGIVGKDVWEKHWENRKSVIEAMKASLSTSEEIASRLSEYYSGMVSIAVKERLRPLLESGAIDSDELLQLQDAGYCKTQFGLAYPMLVKLEDGENPSIRSKDSNGHGRYYVNPLFICEQKYLLTSQWYERHRVSLENWLTAHAQSRH